MSDLVVELLARRPPAGTDEFHRLRTLLELLDRPDRAVPTMWVGGTRGKSSVIAMVAAVLAALDVTTGAATRPHLQDMRERLRIAGEAISPDGLRETLRYLDPFLREVDVRHPSPLTFDEVLLAMASTWFSDAPVDVAVFEGRPYETARCDVEVVLDASTATVTGSDGEPREVDEAVAVAGRELAVGGQILTLRGVTGTVGDVYLPLHGRHQARNAAVAFAAVEAFLGDTATIDVDLLRTAFASVRLPGRLEVVRRTDASSVVLDTADDALSATALAAALADEFAVRHRIGVAGLVGQDPLDVLVPLAQTLAHVVVTPAPAVDATPVGTVVAVARGLGLVVETAETVQAALELASGVATAEDAVVVFGDIHTVGAARRALGLTVADDLLHRG